MEAVAVQHTRTNRSVRPFAWQAGLGRSELVRCWDRVEAVLVAVVLMAVCAALPLAGWIGESTHQSRLHTAAAEAASRHQAQAVLLADAPVPASQTDADAGAPVFVQAQWPLANGERRVGLVKAAPGSRAGTTTPIWVDASGGLVSRPLTAWRALWDGVFTGCYAALGAMVTLTVAWRLARWRLDRARLSCWEREWARVEPEWTRRRC
jgi:hypothetical protein